MPGKEVFQGRWQKVKKKVAIFKFAWKEALPRKKLGGKPGMEVIEDYPRREIIQIHPVLLSKRRPKSAGACTI